MWGLAAMIGEDDMGKDKYIHTNTEQESKVKFREHMKLKTTCLRVKQVLEGVIFKKRDEAIMSLQEIRIAVMRTRFQIQAHDNSEIQE